MNGSVIWPLKLRALLLPTPLQAIDPQGEPARALQVEAWLRTHAGFRDDERLRGLCERASRDAQDANLPPSLHTLLRPDLPRLRHPLSGQPLDPAVTQNELAALEREWMGRLHGIEKAESHEILYRRVWDALMGFDALARLPASRTLCDHHVLAHRNLTAALAGARRDGDAVMLYMHVGPVQSFIEASRRTHDLWVASYTIAYLTFLAIHALATEEGPDTIIYPHLTHLHLARTLLLQDRLAGGDDAQVDRKFALLRSSLANRFLAIVPAQRARELAEKAARAVHQGFSKMACSTRDYLATFTAGIPREGWQDRDCEHAPWFGFNAQIRSHLEIDVIMQAWTTDRDALQRVLSSAGQEPDLGWVFPKETHRDATRVGPFYGALFDWTHRVLAAHRAGIVPPTVEGDRRPKCTGCGIREQMGPRARHSAEQQRLSQRFWHELSERIQRGEDKAPRTHGPVTHDDEDAGRRSLQVDHGEGLCAVCLTKRFAPQVFFGGDENPSGLDLRWNRRSAKPSDRFLLRFPSVPSIASAPFRRQLIALRATSEKAGELLLAWLSRLAILEGSDCLRFNAPGNLLPGLGTIGRADRLLSIEGAWLYPESYEPDAAWSAHEADIPDMHDGPRYARYQTVHRELPAAHELFQSVCSRAHASASPYYAALVLDGDHMGQWLTGKRAPRLGDILSGLPEALQTIADKRRPLFPALHGDLSDRLGRLSIELCRIVEKGFLGRVVYTGGDDLLALLPLCTALPCLRAIRQVIRDKRFLGDCVTISAGIAVAHFKDPLGSVLHLARDAERDSKEHRNRFTIVLDKRSGVSIRLTLPFDLPGSGDEPSVDVIQGIVGLLDPMTQPPLDEENSLRGAGVAYRLEQELFTLEALPEAFLHRLKTLLGLGIAQTAYSSSACALLHALSKASTAPRTIVDLLLLARFLLREERGIPTQALIRELSKELEREEAAA